MGFHAGAGAAMDEHFQDEVPDAPNHKRLGRGRRFSDLTISLGSGHSTAKLSLRPSLLQGHILPSTRASLKARNSISLSQLNVSGENLYGRQEEVLTLRDAHRRSRQARESPLHILDDALPEMVLVYGVRIL
jgi:hypothetical protein